VTGLLSTCGSQFQDWTSSYRLFSQLRLDPAALFAGIRSACLEQVPDSSPLCISVDDSLLPKTGPKTPGVAWRRDPQGPPFQTNLIRAQRVLQFSALVPVPGSPAVRGIPIDFLHAPTPPKLAHNASDEQKQEHKKLADTLNLSTRALEQWKQIQTSFAGRRTILLSDARFTTQRFLSGLPAEAILVGRIRKDAKLFYLPTDQPAVGRRRLYGAPAPTPEQIRQDESRAWQPIRVHAAGADHDCRVKVLDGVLWQPAGAQRILRVVVIAPLAYRPRKGSRLRYRDPAFLICTDPDMPVEQIVQFYFWRWDIEVNFRDEKTLLGVGQAQVHHINSCQSVPAFQVAAYAMLLLAASRVLDSDLLPLPKWRTGHKPERVSTQRLIQNLRFEVWGRGLGQSNFTGFLRNSAPTENREKLLQALPSAMLYA
jgi:DDE superfamily endonuclease